MCVDGFSRKVIWLQVCRSNNDPVVPAHFFLSAIEQLYVCPNILRTDCGTENGLMASIQAFLHNDLDTHKYGISQSNQRIENLWSHFKRTYTIWVIDYFKNMVNNDALRQGDHFQMECAWFVYSGLLQTELGQLKARLFQHTGFANSKMAAVAKKNSYRTNSARQQKKEKKGVN